MAPRCPPVRKRAPLTPSRGGDERPGIGHRHISFINCLCRTWGNLGPRSLPLKERTKAERRILRTAVAAEASRSWERASARAPSPHSRKPPCVDGETESRAPQRGNPDPCFLPHAGAAWRGLLLRPGLGSRDPRECLGFREGGRGPEQAALFSSGSGVRPARSLIVRLCFELFPPTRALTAPAGNTEGRGLRFSRLAAPGTGQLTA